MLLTLFLMACDNFRPSAPPNQTQSAPHVSPIATPPVPPPAPVYTRPVLLDAPLGKVQTFEGTFQGLEEGDYLHLNVQGASGPTSFWCMDAACEGWDEKPTGTRIKVIWKKVKENIPEAGGEMELEMVISITAL